MKTELSVFAAKSVSPVPVYGLAAAAAAAAGFNPKAAAAAAADPAAAAAAAAGTPALQDDRDNDNDNPSSSSSSSSNSSNSSKSYLFSTGSSSCSTKFLLASGGDDGTTRVWDLRTKKCILKAQHHYQILSVALDGIGCRVFAGSLDNTIQGLCSFFCFEGLRGRMALAFGLCTPFPL
ncbi:hypothetical protein, conserved [Eimeria brunetti]|uniref:Uncharacterized protein n=1 Tax=Eimeria brunetti TaxID=51314 RepID=U6LJ10_9EIME|nr:hypothetical protein, conserved [Eimeria brunetti]